VRRFNEQTGSWFSSEDPIETKLSQAEEAAREDEFLMWQLAVESGFQS